MNITPGKSIDVKRTEFVTHKLASVPPRSGTRRRTWGTCNSSAAKGSTMFPHLFSVEACYKIQLRSRDELEESAHTFFANSHDGSMEKD